MRLAAGLIVAGALSAPCAAWAQDTAYDIPPQAPPPSDEFVITVMPYGWLAGVSGPAEVAPGLPRPDIDSSGGSIFDNLDFFGFAVGEVNKGAWGAVVDVAVVSLTFDDDDVRFRDGPALLSGELGLDGTVLTLEGFYRVQPTPDVDIDLLAGVRAFWLDLDLQVEGPLGGTLFEGEADNSWADVVVGGRVRWKPGRWTLVAQADVGGGDDTSNWGAFLTANYRVTESFGIVGGYRWLEFDYGKGDRDVKLLLDGPLIGATWTF